MRVMTDREIELLDSKGYVPDLHTPGIAKNRMATVSSVQRKTSYNLANVSQQPRRARRLPVLGRIGIVST